jgi:hypothetical protein
MCFKGPEGVVSLMMLISFSPAPLCYPLVTPEEGIEKSRGTRPQLRTP